MPIKPVVDKPGLPSGAQFWCYASGYLDAGNATLKLVRDSGYPGGEAAIACTFLYFRSIELAIKAILSDRGKGKWTHSLKDLLQALPNIGSSPHHLGLEQADVDLIEAYSDDYSNKWFEYADRWVEKPNLDHLQQVATRLCKGTRN